MGISLIFGKGLNLFFKVILSANSLNLAEEILVLAMSIFIAVSLFLVFDTSFLGNFFSSFQMLFFSLFSSKRACLLNFFFSSILHTFDLELPEGAPLPDLRGVTGITVTPNQYEVIFKPRSGRTNNNVSYDEDGAEHVREYQHNDQHEDRHKDSLPTADTSYDHLCSEKLMNKYNTQNALAMCQRTLAEHGHNQRARESRSSRLLLPLTGKFSLPE